MTNANFDKPPGQPDDNTYPARDALDEIDETVAQITNTDIEERLREILARAGYAGPEISVMLANSGDEEVLSEKLDRILDGSVRMQAAESADKARRLLRRARDQVLAAVRKATSRPSRAGRGRQGRLAAPTGQVPDPAVLESAVMRALFLDIARRSGCSDTSAAAIADALVTVFTQDRTTDRQPSQLTDQSEGMVASELLGQRFPSGAPITEEALADIDQWARLTSKLAAHASMAA